MKKLFGYLLLSVTIFGCLKNNNNTSNQVCNYTDAQTVAPDSQVQKVKAYLDSNNIVAVKAPSGFYYTINSQGTGASVVNLCSVIDVTYKGKFTNGTTFDSTATGSSVTFQLGGVILGWQKSIPLVKGGGSITLYIPPALGYGQQDATDAQGHVIVPGNSILIFDVAVLSISG